MKARINATSVNSQPGNNGWYCGLAMGDTRWDDGTVIGGSAMTSSGQQNGQSTLQPGAYQNGFYNTTSSQFMPITSPQGQSWSDAYQTRGYNTTGQYPIPATAVSELPWQKTYQTESSSIAGQQGIPTLAAPEHTWSNSYQGYGTAGQQILHAAAPQGQTWQTTPQAGGYSTAGQYSAQSGHYAPSSTESQTSTPQWYSTGYNSPRRTYQWQDSQKYSRNYC